MDLTHGVVYTPQNVARSSENNLDGASYVRVYWLDFTNVRRCRILPVKYFKALLNSNRPGVNMGKVALGMAGLTVAPGFTPIGEYLYAIETASLRPCPFAPGHMAVFGRFEEKVGNPSVAVDLCPRTLLRRILEDAKQSHGTEFLVGVETEFILLKSVEPLEPVNVHEWSTSAGLLTGSIQAVVLEEIADSIQAAGITLEVYHAESAPSQFELVVSPLTPLDAADALVFTREIIVQISAKHGLHATFAPRPFENSPGSGVHAHVSVHAQSEQKIGGQLSSHEAAFLAGMLDHLPAIAALTLPTAASYKRVADGVWSGGTYVCYGTENRETSVRVTNVASPASRNFEARFMDGTANPYLAFAAMCAGGLIGLRGMLPLEMQDCGEGSAAEMTETERQAHGITKRMPLSIEEARSNLRQDGALCEILGLGFVDKYLAVNETLETEMGKGDKVAQLTRLVKSY
ncbi:hypothetical protein FB45DRAFT_477249 [Roridomyces roridus]|uniref:GS catalytic domain-containing protein n=1 Tax=Roridomyces roridus TaxID=1738132 RepID=A0AAD7FP19_9AGAR|nr:hypothetical protein FB45DRAFT_477249 [Roridomyces roridus]